jgi:cobyrinic acid a,c-diamide synthase
MVGAIEGDAVMHPRPVGRGYVQLQATDNHPWLPAGSSVRGHEFHHASLDNLPADTRMAYRVARGHGISGSHDGVCVHNLLASFAHLRTGAGSSWAPAFVGYVQRIKLARSAIGAASPAALVCAP